MLHFFRPEAPTRWHWLTLTGPDAQDFLHRITTAHVRALAKGQGVPACLLSAQGRFRAYFTLWHLRDDAYGFELDGGPGDEALREFLAAIDQYTFAERMQLEEPADHAGVWLFPESASDLKGPLATLHAGESLQWESGLRACHHGEREYDRPWLSLWGPRTTLEAWLADEGAGARALDAATIEGWRIAAGAPRVGAEVNAQLNPLELGLREAIADNKGCYPGQEVIEKIIALGAPARRLARIEGRGAAPAVGEAILNLAEPAAEVGEVTSVATAEGGGFRALGIVRKVHAKEGLEVRFAGGATGAIAGVSPA